MCIRFNNEDKATSPVSWEEHDSISVTRQLIMGGSSKYLINGRVAQPRYSLAALTDAGRPSNQLQLSTGITCCDMAGAMDRWLTDCVAAAAVSRTCSTAFS